MRIDVWFSSFCCYYYVDCLFACFPPTALRLSRVKVVSSLRDWGSHPLPLCAVPLSKGGAGGSPHLASPPQQQNTNRPSLPVFFAFSVGNLFDFEHIGTSIFEGAKIRKKPFGERTKQQIPPTN